MFIIIFIALHYLFNSRVTSLINSIVVSYMSIMALPQIINDDLSDYNEWGKVLAHLLLHYMLYDLYFNCGDRFDYILHHILTLSACMYVLYFKTHYTFVLFISINEISTIFMALMNLKIWKTISGIMFAFTFFVSRICWLLWIALFKSINDRFLLSLFCMHYCINVFWFYKICNYLKYRHQI